MTRVYLTVLLPLLILGGCKTFNFGSDSHDEQDGTPDFKHQIIANYQEPLFFAEGEGKPRWVKFTIVLGENPQIYFQNTDRFSFHYDFVSTKIPGFEGISRDQFDNMALYSTGRKVVLGAVLAPPEATLREYAIQLVGTDAFSAEEVITHFKFVQENISALDEPFQAFYLPTYQQASSVARIADQLAEVGIEIITLERWIRGDQCYTLGWAAGRLNYVEHGDIDAAYRAGRLRPQDILLTDGIPAELPNVAGILSLSPSTPNSHVALLASAFRIPFAYIKEESLREQLRQWDLRYIALATNDTGSFGSMTCKVVAYDLSEQLSDGGKAYLQSLKKPLPVAIDSFQTNGPFSYSLDRLPEDGLIHVGGKASNFRYLRQSIPDQSPSGVAFSFNLWHEVMQLSAPGEQATLKDKIKQSLARFDSYPPASFAQVADELKDIRSAIVSATLTPTLQQKILTALREFDGRKKIRFRSSSNAEDNHRFSGAGLYESYSGCLDDDRDTDDVGPSQCDDGQANEKGVFRAIKKVLASFYNDNAYLERLRHGISEDSAAMAILVHYSFPDSEELANGVITYKVDEFSQQMMIASQPGAYSVANPDLGAKPELVRVDLYDDSTYLSAEQYSSHGTLGAYVLQWESEYKTLVALVREVTRSFKAANPTLATFTLDFEYKKNRDQGLVIKQVRLVPRIVENEGIAPILLAAKTEFCPLQGEQSHVFAIHRLKSRWNLRTKEVIIGDGFDRSPFSETESTFSGPDISLNRTLLSERQGYRFSSSTSDYGITAVETFYGQLNDESAELALKTTAPARANSGSLPIVFPDDLSIELVARHPNPKPTFDSLINAFSQVTEDVTRLVVCQDRASLENHLSVTREVKGPGTIKIETTFMHPQPPQGLQAGYTAPLVGWVETKLTGFTLEPIVLKDFFSQTNRPGHHNFSDRFLFQPNLKADLPAAQKVELAEKDIEMIYFDTEGGPDEANPGVIYTFGRQGTPTAVQGYTNTFR